VNPLERHPRLDSARTTEFPVMRLLQLSAEIAP
jgi:hypothetical protein